ncbi:hypothetical protein T12_12055 [Trichinella patagoniensis]|uniref:Uncharacterized protein n=1 Tax=Trichinella patagoniensis TaxID=990121 RepID=A0A0V0Z4M6_9BILA|nr:hypothetical protein T12_8188 [Trichinella patagoniensis]KRY07497.1 hypothetical protein T12_12055 [Trichinella patagoniensis]
MSATNGESGRIDGPEWVRLQEFHTDAEVRCVMRAIHVQETVDFDGLKSTLFEASRVRPGVTVTRELTMLKASVSAMKTDVDQEDKQPALRSRKRQPLQKGIGRKSGGRGAAVKGTAYGQHPCGCKEIAATAATPARVERKQTLLDVRWTVGDRA